MSSARFEGVEKPSLNLPQGALSANQPKPNSVLNLSETLKSKYSLIRERSVLSAWHHQHVWHHLRVSRERWWIRRVAGQNTDGDSSLLKSWETLRGFGLKLAYPRQESPQHEEKGTRWHPDQLYYHSLGTNKLGLVSAVLIRGREKGGL